jgi:streptogramin lyase
MRVLATVAAAAFLSLAGGSGSGEPTVLARVTTGTAPCGAVAAFGALWVANDGGTLVRIDPARNRVTRRIRVGPGSCSLAAGFGAIWVANYNGGLLRVVPNRKVRRISVGAAPFDVAVAFGRVWVTAWEDGKLAVVNPRTLRVERRIAVGPRPVGLIPRNGAIWVGFGRSATSIARVDPAAFTVRSIDVGTRAPGWPVAGARGLWFQADEGNLVHVHPETGRVLARLRLGRTLAQGGLAQDGTLWIPDKELSVVHRVDPASERVLGSFPAGPGAYIAVRAFSSMWVASYAGRDVWRFRP